MRVLTWNVNSVLARKDRLCAVLNRHQPDIVGLQETKGIEEKFPFDCIRNLGYEISVFGQKAYNGVSILSKNKHIILQKGFLDGVTDEAARFLEVSIGDLFVLCAYFPNGQAVGTEKYRYKLDWFKRLRTYLDKRHKPEEKIILMGDFNVAPEDRDVHDPKEWEGKILFSDKEKEALKNIMDFGFLDTFRLHQKAKGFYSWWDYRTLGFQKNRGLRIDFILATAPLAKNCISSVIDREERKGEKPSDHAPVISDFK